MNLLTANKIFILRSMLFMLSYHGQHCSCKLFHVLLLFQNCDDNISCVGFKYHSVQNYVLINFLIVCVCVSVCKETLVKCFTKPEDLFD